MGILSNKVSRDELKAGDHIYTWRKMYTYSHHGIYVGEGKTIHFTAGSEEANPSILSIFSSTSSSSTTSCLECGDQSHLPSAGVISTCLDCFLKGGNLYRYEYNVGKGFFIAKTRGGTCTLAPSDPPEEVLHRANYLLNNGGFSKYNLFKSNCEDFAIYCKTGLIIADYRVGGSSGQVTTLLGGLTLLGANLSGYIVYSAIRIHKDIGNRKNVLKIPVEELLTLSGVLPAVQDATSSSQDASSPA